MNARLKRFEQLFKESETKSYIEFDEELFVLFDEFTTEEKICALNGRKEKLIIQFLQTWNEGIILDLEANDRTHLRIGKEGDHTKMIGGPEKSYSWIQAYAPIEMKNRFRDLSKRIHTEEELYPSFLHLVYYPIESVISLLQAEDIQVVSVVLDTIKQNDLTRELYEKLKVPFEGKVNPILRPVQKSVLREIERVLERKLYTMFDN